MKQSLLSFFLMKTGEVIGDLLFTMYPLIMASLRNRLSLAFLMGNMG